MRSVMQSTMDWPYWGCGVLRGSRNAAEFYGGDITTDPDAGTVTRGGAAVKKLNLEYIPVPLLLRRAFRACPAG